MSTVYYRANTVTLVTDPGGDSAGRAATVTASCNAGEVAVGGGYRTPNGIDIIVNASYPGTAATTPGSNATAWTFRAYTYQGSQSVTFYAVCVPTS